MPDEQSAPSQRRSAEAGSSFIQLLCLIGLFALVVGVVMLVLGDTILDTFRENAESMEASSIGSEGG